MSRGTPTNQAPLGWPEGSVRAVLALMITFSFWLIVLLPPPVHGELRIPLNTYVLLTFVFVFFASRTDGMGSGATGAPRPPLWLPPLFVRIVILFGTAAVLILQYNNNPEQLKDRLTPSADELPYLTYFGLAMFAGFTFGYLLRAIPGRNSYLFQFFHAWLSMIAMIALLVEMIVHAFIMPSLSERISLTSLEMGITAIVACYFGTRG